MRIEETVAGVDRRAVALALYDESQALWSRGEAQAAADRLDAALQANPDFAEGYAFGAYILERRGAGEAAQRFYERAIGLDPNMTVAWSNYGKLLFAARRFDKALACFDVAAAQRPANADVHNSRAGALRELGRLEESEAAARASLALNPNGAEAMLNLGNALLKQGRTEEALEAFGGAARARAPYADALCGEALALRGLGRIVEARDRFAAAEALGCAEAVSGRGCLDLMLGDFENGWEGYEARWLAGRTLAAALGARFPTWAGPHSPARRVLVINDHGFGDSFQFVRYLPLMERAGVCVTYVAPPALHRALSSASGARLIDRMPTQEAFDAQIALSSLPRAFRTRIDSIPAQTPYLAAEPDLRAKWAERIGREGFKIGVVWQGNPDPAADRARSYALNELAPLAAVAPVRLISLQKDFGAEALRAADPPFALETFEGGLDAGADAFVDTAAAMMALDLIVTCDTSIAHLAGALARPVWLALKFDAEWRWLRERDDSPWYPTARLFRQPAPRDWGSVFAAIAAALPAEIQSRMA